MGVSEDQESSQKKTGEEVRLQKALAAAGIASRRACETLIGQGRVRVNGRVVRELGTKIYPDCDEVLVDGVVVQLDVSRRYFMLNKPRGVVSTMHDEHGRKNLSYYAEKLGGRFYNVGRLDYETSGLLILTNDGDLAHRLAHPKFGIPKTYIALLSGSVKNATVQKLRQGFELEDGWIAADRARVLERSEGRTLMEITLHSGRNRIVRRMMDHVGHPVVDLVRKRFGPLHLGALANGQVRELSAAERVALLTAVASGHWGQKEQGPTASTQHTHPQQAAPKRSRNTRRPPAHSPAISERKTRAKGKVRKYRTATAGRPGDGAGSRGLRGIARPR